MAFIVPQVEVFQEFQAAGGGDEDALRAHITGPHAQLIRFNNQDERELGRLDYYNHLVDEAFEWPNLVAGAQVDFESVRLFMTDALLRYFEDSISSGSLIERVGSSANRIRSDSVNFARNTATWPRDSQLLDRDVQPGDIAEVRFLDNNGDPVTMWSPVKGLEGDRSPSDVKAATEASNNAADQTESATTTQTDGVYNGMTATADPSSYNGLQSGNISETYRILVTDSSQGGDITTARLAVFSASGEDDEVDVHPAAKGMPTAIGTRGLDVTFDDTDTTAASESASDAGVSSEDLIAGQEWTVDVSQDWTGPTPSANTGDNYTGDVDTTYIVEVTEGGLFSNSDRPQVTVTTTNGVDQSGPTTVPSAGTAVAVGTEGVTISFSGGTAGLRRGDRYLIEVDAAGEGAIRTIILSRNIPSNVPANAEAGLSLYIRKPELEINQERLHAAPTLNFETSDTEITVQAGITVLEESWTDNGVLQPLPVVSAEGPGFGLMFVEYRAWRQDLISTLEIVQNLEQLNDVVAGPLDPANPLKWAVFKALANSNGTGVGLTAVGNPNDLDSWSEALEALVDRDEVYNLVPLANDRDVQTLFQTHVETQSAPERGLWRAAWFTLQSVPTIPVVHAGSSVPNHTAATTSDDNEALAVIEDDPDQSGTQFTIVRVPDGNADFITNGVQPGDLVRYNFSTDGFGNTTYDEDLVAEVQTEDQLRLTSGPASAIVTPSKIEVWRNLSRSAEAEEIARQAGAWGDRRIRAIWPDMISTGTTNQEGYFLAAALAGLAAGVVPQQGLTNVEISGFSSVPRTTRRFNAPHLNTMAEGGVWIVTQDQQTGQIFTRHAITTAAASDFSDIDRREEMVTRNADSISFSFKSALEPFIGKANVQPGLLRLLRQETNKRIARLQRTNRPLLGGQLLLDTSITELRQHTTLKDHVVIRIDAALPVAANQVELTLVI